METELRTVKIAALQIAYEQTGPDAGQVIVLLHGFPYDVRQFDEVRDNRPSGTPNTRSLFARLRSTSYRSPKMFRSGQQAALGKDVVDFLEALEVEGATLVGFDWGSRAACVGARYGPSGFMR